MTVRKSLNTIAEHVLASSPAILYACKAYGDLGATFVSENVTDLFGYTRQECLENPNFWRENIHPDDQDRVFENYDALYVTDHHVHEYRFRTKDGKYLWILDELRLIRDEDGNPQELVGSWLDITNRKRMEENLRENARIKSEFIATASHELRTPLSVASGYTELLLEHDHFSTEERKEMLSCIFNKMLALERIIDELLDVNRIESGRTICLDCNKINIATEVHQVMEQMEREASGHRFACHFDDEEIELHADRGKLVQVLENLIGNAVKFSPKGGEITVRGETLNGKYRIKVADEGIGMSAEQVERIFELFYRADNSNTAARGLGLGLHLTKNIIEAHRGEIWAASSDRNGSQFYFTLPLPEDT